MNTIHEHACASASADADVDADANGRARAPAPAAAAVKFGPLPGQWPRRLALLVSLATLSLSFGCTPAPSAALRVGINPWPGYEFMFLAQEKGFYRDAGLEVRLIEFSSLSDARRAFERGQIDAMGTTVVEVLQVRDQSARSPEVVQVVDYSNGADVILARPCIANSAGLRGARIGVELGSLGVYMLARGLEKNGLGLADVKLIAMDQLSMEEAFRKGELDALVTYPPVSIKLLRGSLVHPVFSSAEIPGEVLDVIAVEAQINRERPADVAKFLRAFERAIAYTEQNPQEAYRIMAAREGLTPAEFAMALTEGVKVLGAADQAAFLQPGGKLGAVIDATDRILRQSAQIKGPDRRAGIANPALNGARP